MLHHHLLSATLQVVSLAAALTRAARLKRHLRHSFGETVGLPMETAWSISLEMVHSSEPLHQGCNTVWTGIGTFLIVLMDVKDTYEPFSKL